MAKIQVILADIDGTLTEGGNLTTVNSSLKKSITEVRDSGILFSLASARPWFEQREFHQLLISPYSFKNGEGILYEASCVRLLGSEKSYCLGGLSAEQIREIEQFVVQQKLFTDMVHQANNDRYETTTGYVTLTFISEGKTDVKLLEQTYQRVKPILEEQFPFLEAVMSADAIDVNAKGVTKAKPAQKYSQIIGVPLENIAAIGDSGNDIPMLDLIGKAGGLAIYVGKKTEQEVIVKQYSQHFIPTQKGVMGTVEGLQYIIKFNGRK
ncbi:MAG: HAD family hydrolase [Nanoarchaeota archaeon]|nr:HAD family hydrolase [Nanoarchaeota archaeon]